ncbi:MAG: menaquinone biosynthesis protein [Bryobacterales bacterium]|nr:menaquinone biosynthesis protein [Bryobacterales bacterium]
MLRSNLHPSPVLPPMPRLCAVHYLNTLPLIWGLLAGTCSHPVELSMASPADCAERLRKGEADLGLVPVAEMARQRLPLLPGTCISSDGPVRSILLVSRKPWREVATLVADVNSRTSVVLAQIVLQALFGVRVSVEAQPPSLPEMLSSADAALLIGDAALHVDPSTLPFRVLDLGEEWQRLTGLPMVYAAWAGPAVHDAPWLEAVLVESLAHGEANLDAIVEQEAANHGVERALASQYLSRNIRFHLGERERAGMAEFLRRAVAMELIVPESAEQAPSPALEEVKL